MAGAAAVVLVGPPFGTFTLLRRAEVDADDTVAAAAEEASPRITERRCGVVAVEAEDNSGPVAVAADAVPVVVLATVVGWDTFFRVRETVDCAG